MDYKDFYIRNATISVMNNKEFYDNGDWDTILQTVYSDPAYCSLLKYEEKFIRKCIDGAHGLENVVDIGTGTGRLLEQLIIHPFKKIYGVDINQDNITKIQQKHTENPRVAPVYCDAKQTLFPENHMDCAILGFNFIGNTLPKTEQEKLLQETHRYLKPNGKVIGYVYAENALGPQTKLYKDLGFEIISTKNNIIECKTQYGSFQSQRFSEEQFKELFESHGFNADIHHKDFALFYVAEKN